MTKPQAVRVPTDDCMVPVGGEEYAVHEGEWVEVLPILKARDLRVLNSLATVGDRIAIAEGDPNEAVQVAGILDASFVECAEILAKRVLAWNWTDMDGSPLPQPRDNPSVIMDLTTEEMFYLVTLIRGDGLAQQKKDSQVWLTTSSDSPPAPIPNGSATALSHMPGI